MRIFSILVLLLSFNVSAFADNWDGDWKVDDNIFSLHETNGLVTGDIKSSTNIKGTILGVSTGKRLRGVFIMDGKVGIYNGGVNTTKQTFTLLFQHKKDTSDAGLWNGKRQKSTPAKLKSFGEVDEAVSPFVGTWNTVYGTVRLHGIGNKYIVGDYGEKGVIFGVVSDNRLNSTFTNGSRMGRVGFRLAGPDQIKGTWRWISTAAENASGGWTGRRTSNYPGTLSQAGDGKKYDATAVQKTWEQGYRARENAKMQSGDYCGPASLTDHAPDLLNSAVSLGFTNICKRHDACYRLEEKSQQFCDDQMSNALDALCDKQGYPLKPLCMVKAKLFSEFLDTTLSADAFAASPAGNLLNVKKKIIKERLSSDEFQVCVDVHNPTTATQEYDVVLQDKKKRVVDTEPDLYEFNVHAGKTKKNVCVGTYNDFQGPDGSILGAGYSDLEFPLTVLLRVDATAGFQDLLFGQDKIMVDHKLIQKPARKRGSKR